MTMRNRAVDGVRTIVFGFTVPLVLLSHITQATGSTEEMSVHGSLSDTGVDLPTGRLPNTAGAIEEQWLQQHRLPATREVSFSGELGRFRACVDESVFW